MKFFKNLKKSYESAYAEETVDPEFDVAKNGYFNVEAAIVRLANNMDKYSKQWDGIVALRKQIAGDFLYFYGQESRNRDVGTAFHEFNRDIFETNIHAFQGRLKQLITKMKNLGYEFQQTKLNCEGRETYRKNYDRKRYALKQFTNQKNFNAEEAARKHAKLKNFENQYRDETRKLRAVFSDLQERKASLMDESFGEFISVDYLLLDKLGEDTQKLKELEQKMQSRDQQDLEAETQRIQARGDLDRRRLSTWTQQKINKLKNEYHFVEKKTRTMEAKKYYFIQEPDPHPLRLKLQDALDFNFLHEIFAPTCKKHPKLPDLKLKPSKIRVGQLQQRTFSFKGNSLLVRTGSRRSPRVNLGGLTPTRKVQQAFTALPVYISKFAFSQHSHDDKEFLSFDVDEKIFVHQRDPSGWLFGQLDEGEAGWFPESFVYPQMEARVSHVAPSPLLMDPTTVSKGGSLLPG